MTDKRFGYWNKFGNNITFGQSTTSSYVAWGVEVDWDGDYIFDGSNEARYMVSIRGYRGRPRYINRDGKGFERLLTGRYTITLDNSTGRYDAWNTSSPLYPNVSYGKDVRIKVRSFSSGVIYPVFYGIIENIEPVNNSDGEKRVVITVVDGWQYLRNYNARYAIQEDIPPEDAIGYTLDSIAWSRRWGRNLDTTADSINYWWANGNKQAASVIEDIAESFLGYAYVDRNGAMTFKARTNIGEAVTDLTSAILLKDLSLPQPWEYARNVTRVKVHPRIAAANGVIYTLVGTPPIIQNGESLTIFGEYVYNNEQVPATNVTISDFATNTQEDGGGTDKTADCTAVLTDFGDSGKMVITNNSGGTVYLITLELSGDALYEPNTSDVIYQTSDFESMPREFLLNLTWNQDVNVASDFSNLVGPYLAELHPFPIVQVEARPDEQFTPDLFDIVSLSLPNLGILGDSYRVAYIEHESIEENCQAVLTKFALESYIILEGVWIWDTQSVFDTSTVFGA